jgi:hypothetical protein
MDGGKGTGGESFEATSFAGFALSKAFADGKARIRDVELGERLGYSETRFVRRLIKSLQKSKRLNDVRERATAARLAFGPDRAKAEYWLTRDQALFVIIRSDQPIALAITAEVIAVFEAYLDGKLSGTAAANQHAAEVAELRAALAELRGEFRALATKHTHLLESSTKRGEAPIAPETHAWLIGEIKRIAVLEVAAGDWPLRTGKPTRKDTREAAVKRAMTGIRNALSDNRQIDWGRKGKPWHRFPANRFGEVVGALGAREVDVMRKLRNGIAVVRAIRENEGQMTFGDLFDALASKRTN